MRILLVEDDKLIGDGIKAGLSKMGFSIDWFTAGLEGKNALYSAPYDAAILDLTLPGIDGLDILREWRDKGRHEPVLILTARDDEADKVIGLGAGADDYMTKPFSMRELIARCKALLRRVEMDKKNTAAADELHYRDIRYSATENAVFCGSTIVALTQTELRLLSYMLKQPEKAYSREELLNAVWGFDSEVETRVTDETLRRIRKKLLQAGSTVSVSTIWGFGY